MITRQRLYIYNAKSLRKKSNELKGGVTGRHCWIYVADSRVYIYKNWRLLINLIETKKSYPFRWWDPYKTLYIYAINLIRLSLNKFLFTDIIYLNWLKREGESKY